LVIWPRSTGKLRLGFEELGVFPYFDPTHRGLVRVFVRVMGLKNVKVQLQDWSQQNPDPGRLMYHVSWTR